MPKRSVFDMPFTKIYSLLTAKAERKGRTRAEVDDVICWLTGYPDTDAADGMTYGEFITRAPAWNPRISEA